LIVVDAVIFDWGGTLTPWRTMDPGSEWAALAAALPDQDSEEVTQSLAEAAELVWERSRQTHRSATLAEICELAGVDPDEEALAAYRAFWDPATFTDPDVPALFTQLRDDGVRIGVLSNTVWPRAWHEEIFRRDGVLHLIDAAVYTSEIDWTKPSPHAFIAAMTRLGVTDPEACVFVGDRLFDDIFGARQVGMRAVLLPHSDIPDHQAGHTPGEPDGIIQRLADLPAMLTDW
jgi:putative hydrolase of the HAD superfamily